LHEISELVQRKEQILQWAREAIETESTAVADLTRFLDHQLVDVINCILSSKGRVVITGIGKSAAIATKIVATLNSTGTPAIFMHAADAVHGDLGIVQKDDVVICISKSGNTPEVKALVPLLKRGDNPLIGIVADLNSFLAERSDMVLHTPVAEEACPNNLAPTTSTTVQLVMGDALAVCLLKARGFSSSDFARYHPGGSLGKKLYLTLGDIVALNDKPSVSKDARITDVILEISAKRLGATVVQKGNELVGVITDGDIRRMLSGGKNMNELKASDIMNSQPITLDAGTLAVEAAKVMSEKKISQIIVLENNSYAGMVHIHDLNKEGILS